MKLDFEKAGALTAWACVPMVLLIYLGVSLPVSPDCGAACIANRANSEHLLFCWSAVLAFFIARRVIRKNYLTGNILGFFLIVLPVMMWKDSELRALVMGGADRIPAIAYAATSVVVGLFTLYEAFKESREPGARR